MEQTVDISKAFKEVAKDYPLTRAYLFGSRARSDARRDSDFDIFIDVKKGFTLFDLCGITNDLEDKLGIPCDIATRTSLKMPIRRNAEKEGILIYER